MFYRGCRITHTHTHNRLTAFCPGLPGYAGTRRNIHPLTPILIIGLPLSSSSIYNDPWHPLCSVTWMFGYKLDSPLGQPLSRSSLVFLLALDPQLHTPCISSPSHLHLFAAHAHTNAACFAAIPMLCHLYLVSLSAHFLGVLSFSLTPHIHLTILISARWSATTFSFLTGQVSLDTYMLCRHWGTVDARYYWSLFIMFQLLV